MVLWWISVALAFGQQSPDANEIVKRSLARDLDNVAKLENYTYEEVIVERRLDKKGVLKKTSTKVREYLVIDGTRYDRLVEEDGKPLEPRKAKKEQEKMDREIAKRRNESAEQKRKRLAEQKKDDEESRRLREEVAQAYTWELLGEEPIHGAPCWKISATPKPGFKGRTRFGKMLPKFRGTFWINQQGYEWLRVEAETIDKITFGGFLASLSPGATFHIEQMRVNNDFWHPEKVQVKLSARALVMRLNGEVDVTYRNFRKFQTDSRVVSTSEVEPVKP